MVIHKWDIIPNKSLGPIELKMNRNEVHKILGCDYYQKDHVFFPGLYSDNYLDRTVTISYWKDESVGQIELTRPNIVLFNNIPLLDFKLCELAEYPKFINKIRVLDANYAIIDDTGISLLRNEKDGEAIDSVLLIDEGFLIYKQQLKNADRNKPKMTIQDLAQKYKINLEKK